jgi:hypothetical protein
VKVLNQMICCLWGQWNSGFETSVFCVDPSSSSKWEGFMRGLSLSQDDIVSPCDLMVKV